VALQRIFAGSQDFVMWVFRRSRPLFRGDGDRRSGVKPTDEPLMATDCL
jgi:hypothetical protein